MTHCRSHSPGPCRRAKHATRVDFSADVHRPAPAFQATYLLPLRDDRVDADLTELTRYLTGLAPLLQVIIVDGSQPAAFSAHAKAWGRLALHLAPSPELAARNGKVRGVLTGLRYARFERIIIADDDVRYDVHAITQMLALLAWFDVVRPQNYFAPLPWHALWDTGRTLLNRATGGDWPGTLGVRRSMLRATGGYAGNVLFENLELVRTVRMAGGTEAVAPGLYVRRLPPDSTHFWSQRVRQAYDELARPGRLLVTLALLPALLLLVATQRWGWLGLVLLLVVALAEIGRCRARGRRVFPITAALLAPVWLLERSVCIWLALASRIVLGGIPYHGTRLVRAATPLRELRSRHRRLRHRLLQKPAR